MKKKLALFSFFALLAVNGCVSRLPMYPQGTLVTHTASGLRGQVTQWWCRGSNSCQYEVRFATQGVRGSGIGFGGFGASGGGGFSTSSVVPAAFATELLSEYEIEPTDPQQWQRLLDEQRRKYPNKKQPSGGEEMTPSSPTQKTSAQASARDYYDRAVASAYKGQQDQAIGDYTKAISLDSRYAAAYYGRGVAYAYKGNFDQATKDYTKACDLGYENACTQLRK